MYVTNHDLVEKGTEVIFYLQEFSSPIGMIMCSLPDRLISHAFYSHFKVQKQVNSLSLIAINHCLISNKAKTKITIGFPGNQTKHKSEKAMGI